MTLSSGVQPFFTPGPRAATVPATSSPMMSLSPGGGGYSPRLCGKQKHRHTTGSCDQCTSQIAVIELRDNFLKCRINGNSFDLLLF